MQFICLGKLFADSILGSCSDPLEVIQSAFLDNVDYLTEGRAGWS